MAVVLNKKAFNHAKELVSGCIAIRTVCARALFLLDAEGSICWSYVSPIGTNPGWDSILTVLEDLSKQEAAR